MKIDIVIPVLNESEYIQKCLDSVFSFKLPEGISVDIYVIDGISSDDTVEKVKNYQKIHKNLFILTNKNKIQSSALNIAIKESNGDFIMRLDAHSIYPKSYLVDCYKTLLERDADNVGGIAITEPGGNFLSSLIVQSITTSKFGVGNSGFRVGALEGERDTVPYGFFRRECFTKFGLFDERLARAQDYEFNSRIKAKGGKIWFNPKIYFHYYNQKFFSNFLHKQFFLEAPYNAYMWYLAPYTFNARHSITLFFSVGVLLGWLITYLELSLILTGVFFFVLASYFLLGIYFSYKQYKRYGKLGLIIILPAAFFLFHFIHGLGILFGISKLALRRSPVS